MTTDLRPEDAPGLYPPRPEEFETATERAGIDDLYEALLESQCGATDDSQPIEQYDGTLGVSQAFAASRQATVGQLQWDDDLASIYDDPGNVSGQRWCTGGLVSHNVFMTAGHCFESNPGNGWRVPRINGTNTPIPPEEIAQRMHVNFDFQDDPDGNPRPEVEFRIAELIEDDPGDIDVAVIRLTGTPGATFGRGRLATADPDVGDMLAIIGHPAGVPKRIEAGPLTSISGDRLRYDDIDTLGGNSGSPIWQSPSGRIVGVHTNGGCNTIGSNSGARIERIRQVTLTAGRLDPLPLPVRAGIHTVRQVSSGRFMDAHEDAGHDFSVVTRPAQGNDTQRWRFTPVGVVVAITQVSSGRFMDAHEIAERDFSVVTRGDQANDTQRWVAMPVPGELSTYTLQQLSNGRFLDAHVTPGADFSVVTRTFQNNFTQRWAIAPLGDGTFTIVQRSTGRFLDAHESAGQDFSVVTRTAQRNDTQRWRMTPTGAVYTIQQVAPNRFLDAHEVAEQDFSVVTRTAQDNDSQRWVVTYLGGDAYTIQQLSSGRYVDAHEHAGADFSVVTRNAQGNATQQWIIG